MPVPEIWNQKLWRGLDSGGQVSIRELAQCEQVGKEEPTWVLCLSFGIPVKVPVPYTALTLIPLPLNQNA